MTRHRNLTVVHYDPTWEDTALCGVRYDAMAPVSLTSRKSDVTCIACIREIAGWHVTQCRVCGGYGEHDWEVHTAELRAIDDAGRDY